MFRGPGGGAPDGGAPDGGAPGLDIKSNENTIESSFTVFNSNPGRFPLFRSNSL